MTTLTAVRELMLDRFEVAKTLVVAPKKVAEGTWMREPAKWDHTQLLRMSLVAGTEKQRISALCRPADIYIIGRDNVTWLVDHYRNKWPFDMVVLDESSSFKNPSAKRFKSLKSVLPHIRRLVELTGTPSPNSIGDLWAQVFLLDDGKRLGRSFTGFRDRFFYPGRRGYDGTVYEYSPKPESDKAVLQLISDICISMKASDYLTLPDIIYDDIPVILTGKAAKAYEEMERQMILDLPEGDITATSAAALTGKLLQLSNGAVYDADHAAHEVHDCKLEAFLELTESLQGKPLLVFYSFQHDKDRILAALAKTGLRVRTLQTPQDEADWNAGKIDVLLAHPASCAYGLNLQDGGNHVVWFGLTWNYELYTQANARLHRQGQTQKTIIHHLISAGTRDEDVMKALQRKEKAQDYVMASLKARIEKYRRTKE